MLGVPVEDHRQLKAWSADFAEMLGNFQHNPDHVPKVLRAVEEMTADLPRASRGTAYSSAGGADPVTAHGED